jgi:lysophospholipase L1-like esterase
MRHRYFGLLSGLLLALFCIGLLLCFDLIYSTFFYDEDTLARISDPVYHHGLAPNFAGHQTWGFGRIPIFSNNLGFKDGAVRNVPIKSNTRRVLLMGDSFTEGTGLSFENTFAGLLYAAGQKQPEKIEFLNAGLASYSPAIYYRKINFLLEKGLRFDEVVLFSDLSDVWDEARGYFCIDDDPKFSVYCDAHEIDLLRQRRSHRTRLQNHFIVTDRLIILIKQAIAQVRGKYAPPPPQFVVHNLIAGWAIPGFDVSNFYAPLGIEGGIERSLANMRRLADVLKAHNIPLTIVVYPWPFQLANGDRESRQVKIWREFCIQNCKEFIDLFSTFFSEREAHKDWYERLFFYGDVHFSANGHQLIFREIAKHLL